VAPKKSGASSTWSRRCRAIWAVTCSPSRTIARHGGTISHQHGVGTDHLPYLAAERGPAAMSALRALCQSFDPRGLMNPGKLFE